MVGCGADHPPVVCGILADQTTQGFLHLQEAGLEMIALNLKTLACKLQPNMHLPTLLRSGFACVAKQLVILQENEVFVWLKHFRSIINRETWTVSLYLIRGPSLVFDSSAPLG